MIGYHDEKDFPNTLEAWSDKIHENEKSFVLSEFGGYSLKIKKIKKNGRIYAYAYLARFFIHMTDCTLSLYVLMVIY